MGLGVTDLVDFWYFIILIPSICLTVSVSLVLVTIGSFTRPPLSLSLPFLLLGPYDVKETKEMKGTDRVGRCE